MVGAFAAVLEAVLTLFLRSNSAARGGSAIVSLITLSALLVNVVRSVQGAQLASPAVIVGTRFAQAPLLASVAASVAVDIVALAFWLASASLTERGVFLSRGRRLRISTAFGTAGEMAALSYWRNPANRLAVVALVGISGFGIWFEEITGLAVGAHVVFWSVVFLMSVTAISTYGDYMQIRWRVLVSPASSSMSFHKWISGQMILAGLIGMFMSAVTLAFDPRVLTEWSRTDMAQLVVGVFLGVGSGLVSGRLIPYREGDVFSMGVSGLLTAIIAGGAYFGMSRIVDIAGGLRVVCGAMFLVACFVFVELIEPRDKRMMVVRRT